MYAHMGMKIEEWEDGQVNIGIAVCPTKPTAIAAAIAASEVGNDMLMSNAGNFVVVPKSAFIIRPPKHYQSQGGRDGVSVTYAHQVSGPSNVVIMLDKPKDQGYHQESKLTFKNGHWTLSPIESNDIITEIMDPIEENVKDESETGDKSETGSEVAEEEKLQDSNGSESESSFHQRSTSPGGRESNILTTPQDPKEEAKSEQLGESLDATTTAEKKATGSSGKETFLIPVTKRSGDMKRVSWVEDAEQFQEKKGSGKSHKENKKDSSSSGGRKSNGVGNGSNRSSPTKKQHGFSSAEDADNEGYTKGNKRSGDRSRIPLIAASTAASAGDNLTSCEFYRRQMLRECMYNNPSSMADNWYDYTSIQKYAGEKVVKKIAAEQKRLEEDISNRRKTEIWILGSDTDDFIMSPSSVPLRKRTMRLKPIQIVQ